MARRSSKKLNPVEAAIRDIYRDTDGSIPDLSRLDHRPRGAHPLFIAGMFAVLLVVSASLLSIYVFAPEARESGTSAARLLITGPETVASGSRATYIITYANDADVAYHDVEVRLEAPEGFIIDRENPKATKGSSLWNLGELAPHEHGTIELSGSLFGTPDAPVTMTVALTYAPDNFHASLVERASRETAITKAPLTLTLDLGDQFVGGEEQRMKATYTNTGELPLTNMMLVVTLPSGGVASMLPKGAIVDAGTATLRMAIGALGPGDEASQEFGITLAAPVDVGETTTAPIATITTELGFFVHERFHEQIKEVSNVAIVTGGFFLSAAANGVTGKGAIGWNDVLTVTLHYDNRGKVTAEDVQIRVALDGAALDWSTLVNPRGAVVKNGEARWTKKEVPALSAVKAGANGTLTFSVRLRNPEDEALRGGAADAAITIEGTALIAKIGKTTKNAVVTFAPLALAVNTDMTARASVRYYNDDNIAVGTGPLPPRVGQPTTYRVFLTVKNHLHELRMVDVRAALPEYVEWTGRTIVGAGDIRYDPTTRIVAWTLNRLPTSVAEVTSQFEIRLTPLPEQVKTIVTVVPEVVFAATDGVTTGVLHATSGALTTALPDDPEVKGKGTVFE